jgi:hypothetical protein
MQTVKNTDKSLIRHIIRRIGDGPLGEDEDRGVVG